MTFLSSSSWKKSDEREAERVRCKTVKKIESRRAPRLKMSVVLRPLLLLVTAVLLLSRQINAEYRQFDGIIQAAASYIHYSEGFVIAPGTLDMSD